MRQHRLSVAAEPAFRTRHANPYNARLYTAIQSLGVSVGELDYKRLLLRPPSVIHLHWPDLTFLSGPRRWRHIARLTFFFTFLSVARLRGTRLVWTVHNLDSHEERSGPHIRAAHRRLLLRNVDAFFSLTEAGLHAVREAYPELRQVPGYVTPHGHYRLDYNLEIHRDRARAELKISQRARVLVSAGSIRAYKNTTALITSFRNLPDDDVILYIAGNVSAVGLRTQIEEAAGADTRIRLDLNFLSPDEMARVLRAADLVVLPYRAIQNSGSAILALSAHRPVLVPMLGSMAELANEIGHNWVRLYPGDVTTMHLKEALTWLGSENRPDALDLAPFSWDTIASLTVAAYEEIIRSPRPRRTRLD